MTYSCVCCEDILQGKLSMWPSTIVIVKERPGWVCSYNTTTKSSSRVLYSSKISALMRTFLQELVRRFTFLCISVCLYFSLLQQSGQKTMYSLSRYFIFRWKPKMPQISWNIKYTLHVITEHRTDTNMVISTVKFQPSMSFRDQRTSSLIIWDWNNISTRKEVTGFMKSTASIRINFFRL